LAKFLKVLHYGIYAFMTCNKSSIW